MRSAESHRDSSAHTTIDSGARGRNAGYVYSARIGRDGDGLTLIDYLSRRYRHSSRDQWIERVLEGRVLLNGQAAAQPERVFCGDRLEWCRPPWVEPATPSGFAVAYQDSDLLVVIKPSGLPTLPGADYLEQTLLHRVRFYDATASPLHRLGRATSGLVAFSRNRAAHRTLSENWRRQVTRWYRALVLGRVPWRSHSCDTRIGRIPHRRLGEVFGASASGKAARSFFSLIERRADTSLVRVRIDTGRAHQIRIHASSLGFPLVGDVLYADGPQPDRDATSLPGTGGYLLHAERMTIVHPRHGARIELECRAPTALRVSGEDAHC